MYAAQNRVHLDREPILRIFIKLNKIEMDIS